MQPSRGLAVACELLLLVGCASPTTSPSTAGPLADRLRDAVRVSSVRQDLASLERIADEHAGIRTAGTEGYLASASLVADTLRKLGYQVQLDTFDVPLFSEIGVGVIEVPGDAGATFRAGQDFRAMIFSPGGDVTAPVLAVGFDADADPIAGVRTGSGCSTKDFAGLQPGAILLVQPGPCFRRTQAENAATAGAMAIIISYAQWDPGEVLRPTLLDPNGLTIPVIGATRQVGLALAGVAARGGKAHLRIHTSVLDRETVNVIADSPAGDPGHVLMIGGHLDSVLDGPGINDNGSGTMGVLEIARRLAAAGPTAWKVRFAFWSGEEIGLWGSRRYVDHLSADDRSAIAAYLNFDMLASPNGGRLVYGDADAAPGSDRIAGLFEAALTAEGLISQRMDLSGASDHYWFERAGIPTGGLFAGANEVKDAAAAASFGGTAGQDYDGCYHRACDRLDRVNDELLGQLLPVAAYVVGQLASGTVSLDR